MIFHWASLYSIFGSYNWNWSWPETNNILAHGETNWTVICWVQELETVETLNCGILTHSQKENKRYTSCDYGSSLSKATYTLCTSMYLQSTNIQRLGVNKVQKYLFNSYHPGDNVCTWKPASAVESKQIPVTKKRGLLSSMFKCKLDFSGRVVQIEGDELHQEQDLVFGSLDEQLIKTDPACHRSPSSQHQWRC